MPCEEITGREIQMASCHMEERGAYLTLRKKCVAWKSVRAVISRRPELNAERERPEFSPRWAERRETGWGRRRTYRVVYKIFVGCENGQSDVQIGSKLGTFDDLFSQPCWVCFVNPPQARGNLRCAVGTGNGPPLISRPLLGGRRVPVVGCCIGVLTGLFTKRDSFNALGCVIQISTKVNSRNLGQIFSTNPVDGFSSRQSGVKRRFLSVHLCGPQCSNMDKKTSTGIAFLLFAVGESESGFRQIRIFAKFRI